MRPLPPPEGRLVTSRSQKLSGCSKLIRFDVSYNKLVGQLPLEFDYSSLKLQVIHISHNQLSGGIPSSYGNLSYLQKFVATINNFHGSIPDTFGKLTNLQVIAFGANKLSGTIPTSIFNISTTHNYLY
ncbi:receptor kinase-like protein Xa21 [Camellia sinensis]|uniref:receptor kinase-like protein Xa21 n=1 Tax=Camellia sinensis TaxID=4442 RepID=UPI001035577A|nr:receptor kinase-like protein Xa21 [Camellia sinensis]